MGLDAYELDRLLTRLALHNAAAGGRRGRAGRQARAAARRGAVAAAAEQHSPAVDAAAHSHSEPGHAGSVPRHGTGAQPIDAPASTANGAAAHVAREEYPASWPPPRGSHDGDYEARSWTLLQLQRTAQYSAQAY